MGSNSLQENLQVVAIIVIVKFKYPFCHVYLPILNLPTICSKIYGGKGATPIWTVFEQLLGVCSATPRLRAEVVGSATNFRIGGKLEGGDEMSEKPKRRVGGLDKKYWGIAEKIVEGLLESSSIKETSDDIIEFPSSISKDNLIKFIAEAMRTNLTYGNLGTLTLRNNIGQIVAKLYILPDGTLTDDSWCHNEGW